MEKTSSQLASRKDVMKVVVIVEGGVVQSVYSDSENIKIDVIDVDDLSEIKDRESIDIEYINPAIKGLKERRF